MKSFKILVAFMAAFAVGCLAPLPGPATPSVVPASQPSTQPSTRPAIEPLLFIRDPRLAAYALMWVPEVVERVGPNVVVVVGHGKTVEGQWCVFDRVGIPSPVRWVVQKVRADHPDRIIVLFVCNPDGILLSEPGVLYGKESLWTVPDAKHGGILRDITEPNVIGSAKELTYNPF